jgi:ABC-type branched-subunit amino acid transport system permease subunit
VRALAAARGSSLLRHLVPALVGLVVVVLLTRVVNDFDNYNFAIIGAYVCAIAGLTLLTGSNGQVSLGHAAFMAIGGYAVALLQQAFIDRGADGLWLLPVTLVIGTLVTALFGAVIGLAAARLTGPYLAGATLSLGVALPSITSHYTGVFKGDQGLPVTFDGPPSGLGSFTLQHWQAWISLFAALIVLVLLANLNRSAVGRHMRAVRDDDVAAQLSGLSVARVRTLAFTVSAAAAGLGGGLFAVALQTASPGSFSLTLSLTLLSAVVIGGLGSLTGAVIGSVIVVYLSIELQKFTDSLGLSPTSGQRLHDNLPPAVYGLLLVLFMLLLPGGIAGLLRRAVALLVRRPSSARAVPPADPRSTTAGGKEWQPVPGDGASSSPPPSAPLPH